MILHKRTSECTVFVYEKLAETVRNYPCLCDKSPEVKISVRWLQFSSIFVLCYFGKYPFPNRISSASLFSHRCRLLLRSKGNSSRRRISSSCVIWKLAHSILQRVFSVANCACHFSYAHATCVNAVMLMLMSQRKPGLSNDNSYGNKKVTNLHI